MQSAIEPFITDLYNRNEYISAITIISASHNSILYQTDNWDISADFQNIISTWNSQGGSIEVQGIRYMALQNTPERLVCTNIKGQGHIIAAKDGNIIGVAYFLPDADIGSCYTDFARVIMEINRQIGNQV